MNDTLSARTVKGFIWMSSASGVESVFRVLSIVVLARLLTPYEFGVMGAATTVIGVSMMFSEMGMGPAIVQREALTNHHVRTAFGYSVASGFVLGGAVFWAAPWIAALFSFDDLESVLKAVSIVFPIQGFGVVAESTLRREMRFRQLSIIRASSYGLGFVSVAIALALMGFGIWALVVATISFRLLSTALAINAARHPMIPSFNPGIAKDLLSFGGGFTLARLLNYSARNVDYLIAGRTLGESALGFYNRAYQLLVAPVQLVGIALDQVMFAAMSQRQSSATKLRKAYRRGASLTAFVFLPVGAVSVLIAPEIVRVALGNQWADSIAPFQVLAIGMYFRAAYRVSDSVAHATGAVYRRSWRQGVYLIAVAVGAWLGQQAAGLDGLAVGVVAALAVNFLLMTQLGVRLVEMRWAEFLKLHVEPALLTVITLALTIPATLTLRSLEASAVATLIVVGLVASIPYVVAYRKPDWLGDDGKWIAQSAQVAFAGRSFAENESGSEEV